MHLDEEASQETPQIYRTETDLMFDFASAENRIAMDANCYPWASTEYGQKQRSAFFMHACFRMF